jgi:hypothetical protein
MQDSLIDTPVALDAAIESQRKARLERTLRSARNRRIRSLVAIAATGIVAVGALVAFIAGEPAAAALLSKIACLLIFVSLVSQRRTPR